MDIWTLSMLWSPSVILKRIIYADKNLQHSMWFCWIQNIYSSEYHWSNGWRKFSRTLDTHIFSEKNLLTYILSVYSCFWYNYTYMQYANVFICDSVGYWLWRVIMGCCLTLKLDDGQHVNMMLRDLAWTITLRTQVKIFITITIPLIQRKISFLKTLFGHSYFRTARPHGGIPVILGSGYPLPSLHSITSVYSSPT